MCSATSGAIWDSVSCPGPLRQTDCRGWESSCRSSVETMTCSKWTERGSEQHKSALYSAVCKAHIGKIQVAERLWSSWFPWTRPRNRGNLDCFDSPAYKVLLLRFFPSCYYMVGFYYMISCIQHRVITVVNIQLWLCNKKRQSSNRVRSKCRCSWLAGEVLNPNSEVTDLDQDGAAGFRTTLH